MPRSITIDDLISFPYSGAGECDLSPDGRRVAYTHQGNIYLFDLERWQVTQSFPGRCPKWSPSNPGVLAYLKPESSGVWIRSMDGTERQIGETTGEVRNIQWQMSANTFEWSQDGRFLAMVIGMELQEKDAEKGGNIDIVVVRPVPLTYASAIVVLDVETNKITFQTESESHDYFVDAVCWGGDSRILFGSGLKGINRHIFSIDTASGQKKVIEDRTGWTSLKGVCADGRTLLTVFQGLKSLPDVYIIFPNSGQSRAVTQLSDPLGEYDLSNAELVEWSSYDGLMLQGVIIPPLGKPMSPEHPTLVYLHGGPTEGGAAIFYRRDWHWLAAGGFQIFAPDFRGSQQYHWVEPPTEDMDYKDTMSGIDWLASQGMCDKTRMGVYGFSYGGYLGAYAIGKTTLFKAAALLGGLYDLRLTCGLGQSTRWNSICVNEMQGAPWEVPHTYQELSPISYVDKVETPVLIMEGEHDTPHEAELYALYLRALGKEVEYVLYKGEGHGLSKSSHKKDYLERSLRWFRKYLTP